MSLRRLIYNSAVLLVPLAALAGASAARAQTVCAAGCAGGSCAADAPGPGPSCGSVCEACQKFHCPPKFIHCTPKPPKIKFKCACPKPVCDPCHLDPTGNYGYTPTCWRPWMAEPNYAHCPVPSPTQIMPRDKAELGPPVPPPVPLPPPPDKELSPTRLETHGPMLAPETHIPTALPAPESLPGSRTESRLPPPPPPPLDTRLPPLPRQ
jgi:hypothetical protein